MAAAARLLPTLACVLAAAAIAESKLSPPTPPHHAQPPKVFFNFNKYDHRNVDETSLKDDNFTLFWSYYKDHNDERSPASYGAYSRDSPAAAWRAAPDSSPIRSFFHDGGNDANNGTKEYTIMNLSYRPRISHGPRRRRKRTATTTTDVIEHFGDKLHDFLDIPLFCWKVLINCRRFRTHVCCPVMPDYMKPPAPSRKRKRTRREALVSNAKVHTDPLFGIPLAGIKRSDDSNNNIHRQKIQMMKRRKSSAEVQTYSRRQWRPTAPSLNSDGRECPVDCYWNPKHPCCEVDRFFPVGPYVETSLLENWMSALFALFGNNPIAFVAFKKVAIVAGIAVGFLLWGWVGHKIGVIQLPEAVIADRKDGGVFDLTSRVMLALDDDEWVKKLARIDRNAKYPAGINRFLCCFVTPKNAIGSTNDQGNSLDDDKEDAAGGLQCYQTEDSKTVGFRSTLECVSDMAYEITLNRSKDDKKEDNPAKEKTILTSEKTTETDDV